MELVTDLITNPKARNEIEPGDILPYVTILLRKGGELQAGFQKDRIY